MVRLLPMSSNPLTRRGLIGAGTASFAAAAAAAAQQSSSTGRARNIVISSANGLACCKKAMDVLSKGGDTLDAVIAGVNLVEEDPNDDSVGYGGLPNEEGVVELDASVMHGPSRRCGAVAGIHNCMYPSRVAKLVMEQTKHVLLVGEGATRFAKAWGFPEVNLLTEHSRMAWMVWKQSQRDANGNTSNWAEGIDAPPKRNKIAELRKAFPNADENLLAYAWERAKHPPTGTINCLSLNEKGEMSGVTTTSGLAWKIPGRIGDSPIIGAGLYVDQDVGAAGSTGLGEENIRVSGAHTIVEAMRRGLSPSEACMEALKRISRNFDDDIQRMKFNINFYALRKDGAIGGSVLFAPKGKPSKFAVNDGGESRLENCVTMYER